MALEAIRYRRGSLQVLDQLQLPHRTHYDQIHDCDDAWNAIRSMRVRGAPAIAMVAALGLAVELTLLPENDRGHVTDLIHEKLRYLLTSRPTAVNLADAAAKLKGVVDGAAMKPDASNSSIVNAYLTAAERMLENDVQDNKAIGKHGAQWILEHSTTGGDEPVSVLTHCNTGSLATAGWGTALGVVRSLHERKALRHAFCTETRPYNQGARLTAYELVHDNIPATLITDSMAAALLSLKGQSYNIAAIVVGADRVAANGDTANKIGTYALALAARHHGVKFLVAAPRTTIDMKTESGRFIKIEERPEKELTSIRGSKLKGDEVDLDSPAETVSIAAPGIGVWNPAFDVTPAELIDGIITEVAVVEKDDAGRFSLQKVMETSDETNGSLHGH